MKAGLTPISRSGQVSGGAARFGHLGSSLAITALLVLGVACGNKQSASPSAAPPASAPAKNGTSAMFQKMKENRPLPPPPQDEGGAGGAAPAAMPALSADFEQSPECKQLAADQKAARDEIEALNRDVLGPASQRAEEAYDNYTACQDDPGCINEVSAFSARQSAYQAAKRAEEQAEKKQEELETRLHDLAEKMAAKCDNDPL